MRSGPRFRIRPDGRDRDSREEGSVREDHEVDELRLSVRQAPERQEDAPLVIRSDVEFGPIGHDATAVNAIRVCQDRLLDELDGASVPLDQRRKLAFVFRGAARLALNRSPPWSVRDQPSSPSSGRSTR